MQRIGPDDKRAARRVGKEGLTLIDALATILVVAFALTAVVSALTFWLTSIRQNRLDLLAKAAAVRQMERLRNQPFDTIASGPFVVEPTNELAGALGQVFACNYNPADASCAGGNPDIRKVTVTVTVNNSRSWRLVSVIAR